MKPSTQIIAPLLAQVMRSDQTFRTLLVVDKYSRLVAAAGNAVDRQILLKALNAAPLAASPQTMMAGELSYRVLAVTKSVFLITASYCNDDAFIQRSAQLRDVIVERLRRYVLQRARKD